MKAHEPDITLVDSPHEVKDPKKNYECQGSKVHVLYVQNADITVRYATYSSIVCNNN